MIFFLFQTFSSSFYYKTQTNFHWSPSLHKCWFVNLSFIMNQEGEVSQNQFKRMHLRGEDWGRVPGKYCKFKFNILACKWICKLFAVCKEWYDNLKLIVNLKKSKIKNIKLYNNTFFTTFHRVILTSFKNNVKF